jgi:K+-transporting ATPase ATPase A chain
MTPLTLFQDVFYLVVLVAVSVPLGRYMANVFGGRRTLLTPLIEPVERAILRLGGVDREREMPWTTYTAAMLLFSFVTMVVTYAIMRLQGFLPFNPMGFGTAQAPSNATALTPDLAFNTAVSFTTNTNWQAYGGETTMSYLSQMAALTTHNFFSAAVGMVLGIVLIRGFARRETRMLGNFWVDLVRSLLYVLIPLSVIGGLLMVWMGMPDNLMAYITAHPLDGGTQIIAQGPVASQEVIKILGINGGGFFNVNSAHPYENPSALSNFFQLLLIFCIPAGLCHTFGRMVGDARQGWALLSAMAILFVGGVLVMNLAEQGGNPALAPMHVLSAPTALQGGGNMEGKEVRFGIAQSTLFATITTDASCGAVDCMHASLMPLSQAVALLNMELGEIVFGGVGSGLYGMLMFAILAVFIAGLMVGRTPEYVGKKIEQKEVKMAMLAVLICAASILLFTALASVVQLPKDGYWNPAGPASLNVTQPGPQGLSEMLYAYSSGTGNNGSAMAGLNANTPFYNFTIGLAMWIGRFWMVIPLMAVAGSLAEKKYVPPGAGTFPTHSALFVWLLVAVVLIVGALTYFPVLCLGPITQHLQLHAGLLPGGLFS